jgi:hypothetical protein
MESEYGDVLCCTEFYWLYCGRMLKCICHVKSEPELCVEMKGKCFHQRCDYE